jgi:hypothetical protein
VTRILLVLGAIACFVLLASAPPASAVHPPRIRVWTPPATDGDPETPDRTLALPSEGSLESLGADAGARASQAGPARPGIGEPGAYSAAPRWMQAWPFTIWRLSWTLR